MEETIPIGTVVAFAGGPDWSWLHDQGWLLCDGAELVKLEFSDLYAAIGTTFGGTLTTFFLPDLRGRFPRGVDHGAGHDPLADQRQPSRPGGLSGDAPGSVLGYRTARPDQRPLTLAEGGEHLHNVPHAPDTGIGLAVFGSTYEIRTSRDGETSVDGLHTHTLAGGNAETRPVNKYVYFIIKFTDELPQRSLPRRSG